MSILVTDQGFAPLTEDRPFTPLKEASPAAAQIDIPSDATIEQITPHLTKAQTLRIDFPSFADGRGFTLARLIRLAGFKGTLHARGHMLADQYAMARRAGFDAVEIDSALAARQPEDQWIFRADWRSHDYQTRMRGAPAPANAPELIPSAAIVAG